MLNKQIIFIHLSQKIPYFKVLKYYYGYTQIYFITKNTVIKMFIVMIFTNIIHKNGIDYFKPKPHIKYFQIYF